MSFEFRLPILPTAPFFSNVKLAALSLSKLGGDYTAAPLTVSIGDYADRATIRAINRWSESYPVLWEPVPHAISDDGFSSGLHRYLQPPRGDVVILIDADACLIRPIDELLGRLHASQYPLVAGLLAHFSPFSRNGDENDDKWREVLRAFGLGDMPLEFKYSCSPPENSGGCPAYFNYGFVAFNRAAFDLIRPLLGPLTPRVLALLADTPYIFFSAQIALSLAIMMTGVTPVALGPEYNCPNSDEMFGYGLQRAEDIRVMHYLRRELFDRHSFLCDAAAFRDFCGTSFTSPVLQLFQRHVQDLPNAFYDGGQAP